MAANASASSARPGAWTPVPYPSHAATHGSFTVIQYRTSPASDRWTIEAYSANRSAVSRSGHPPESSSAWGRSQW